MGKRGPKPMYEDPEEMLEKCAEYFEICKGEPFLDDDGKPMQNKKLDILWKIPPKPPSLPGLALYLGFRSKAGLMNYRDREPYAEVWSWIRMHIEEYNISRLYDHDGVNGAKFVLINNFRDDGWMDKASLDVATSGGIKVEFEVVKAIPDKPKVEDGTGSTEGTES